MTDEKKFPPLLECRIGWDSNKLGWVRVTEANEADLKRIITVPGVPLDEHTHALSQLREENERRSASKIRDAFNKHKHHLKAVETKCCPGTEHLVVMNDGVLLRQMLLELGFPEKECSP